METDFSKIIEDHKTVFRCNYCDYKCLKKLELNQHLRTRSHKLAKDNIESNTDYKCEFDSLQFGWMLCLW